MGYQFEIIYKPGAENKVANALSWIEENQELNTAISNPHWVDLAKVKEEVQRDPNLIQLAETIEKNPAAKPGYILQEGLLFYKGRLMLSLTSSLIPAIL